MDLFEEKFGEKFDANVRNLQLNPFDLKILKYLIESNQKQQQKRIWMPPNIQMDETEEKYQPETSEETFSAGVPLSGLRWGNYRKSMPNLG